MNFFKIVLEFNRVFRFLLAQHYTRVLHVSGWGKEEEGYVGLEFSVSYQCVFVSVSRCPGEDVFVLSFSADPQTSTPQNVYKETRFMQRAAARAVSGTKRNAYFPFSPTPRSLFSDRRRRTRFFSSNVFTYFFVRHMCEREARPHEFSPLFRPTAYRYLCV